METTMQSLRAAGIEIVEFPQTAQRTEADTALWDAITHHTLAAFPDPVLCQHVQSAVGVQSQRGIRLAKERTSLKIDGAVALSMSYWGACQLLNDPWGGRLLLWDHGEDWE